MALKTERFDVQDFIETREEQVGYLDAALEDGDPTLIAAALGDIARARGATRFARETGLSRETIYKYSVLVEIPRWKPCRRRSRCSVYAWLLNL